MTIRILASTGLLLAGTAASQGAFITPTFDTFGSLPAADFGGTGIPNNAVAIDSVTLPPAVPLLPGTGNKITLGLTATQRYFNPALGNDGAGTFYATPGANYGNPATPSTPGVPSSDLGSTWNLGWYIALEYGSNLGSGGESLGYKYELLYDLDPAANTPVGSHGVVTTAGLFSPFTADVTINPPSSQSSQNMNFSGWTTPIPTIVFPPSGTFDPNAPGEYTFSLRAYTHDGTMVAESAIAVVVVPEPSTYVAGALLALPFGFGLLRRRFAAR